MKRLGMFEGRHDLPVERYFFPDGTTEGSPHEYGHLLDLADEVWTGLRDNTDKVVHLYATGLTIGLCAIMESKPKSIVLQVFHYDRETKTHVLGGTFV